jgi:ABC-type uncharacterized transport system permease subunit
VATKTQISKKSDFITSIMLSWIRSSIFKYLNSTNLLLVKLKATILLKEFILRLFPLRLQMKSR